MWCQITPRRITPTKCFTFDTRCSAVTPSGVNLTHNAYHQLSVAHLKPVTPSGVNFCSVDNILDTSD